MAVSAALKADVRSCSSCSFSALVTAIYWIVSTGCVIVTTKPPSANSRPRHRSGRCRVGRNPPLMLHPLVDVDRIDRDARPHRRRHGDGLQVLSFGGRRLRLDDAVHERVGVVDQALRREGRLAERGVNDAGLVDTKLHLARLDLTD